MYRFLFLGLVLFLLFLFVLGTWNRKASVKEAFTKQELNINISPDNQTITIPNTLTTADNKELKFLGNVNIGGRATMDQLIANNTKITGTATADLLKVGEGTFKMVEDTLKIDKPVHFQGNVSVAGNVNVTGHICIKNGNETWYLIVKDGNLHFVKDPNMVNSGNHRNNEAHVIIASDGNIWTSRQSFSGWIGDSLNYIHSIRI